MVTYFIGHCGPLLGVLHIDFSTVVGFFSYYYYHSLGGHPHNAKQQNRMYHSDNCGWSVVGDRGEGLDSYLVIPICTR